MDHFFLLYLIANVVLSFHFLLQVINDADALLWDDLSVSCWPTLVVVSPTLKALIMFEGEGNRDALFSFVSAAIDFYDQRGLLSNKEPSLPLTTLTDRVVGEDVVDFASSINPTTIRLSYPGKIAVSGRRIAVADSANHRIIVGTLEEEDEGEDGSLG